MTDPRTLTQHEIETLKGALLLHGSTAFNTNPHVVITLCSMALASIELREELNEILRGIVRVQDLNKGLMAEANRRAEAAGQRAERMEKRCAELQEQIRVMLNQPPETSASGEFRLIAALQEPPHG